MQIDPSLLKVLACPRCHGALDLRTSPEGMTCGACKLLYEIEDGVPNLLLDEAKPWPAEGSGDAKAGRNEGTR